MPEDQRPKAAALRYEKGKDAAPRLVAKGQGHIAEKILQLAKDNQIPVHEDPALIEILSKMNLDEPFRESAIAWWPRFSPGSTKRSCTQPKNYANHKNPSSSPPYALRKREKVLRHACLVLNHSLPT